MPGPLPPQARAEALDALEKAIKATADSLGLPEGVPQLLAESLAPKLLNQGVTADTLKMPDMKARLQVVCLNEIKHMPDSKPVKNSPHEKSAINILEPDDPEPGNKPKKEKILTPELLKPNDKKLEQKLYEKLRPILMKHFEGKKTKEEIEALTHKIAKFEAANIKDLFSMQPGKDKKADHERELFGVKLDSPGEVPRVVPSISLGDTLAFVDLLTGSGNGSSFAATRDDITAGVDPTGAKYSTGVQKLEALGVDVNEGVVEEAREESARGIRNPFDTKMKPPGAL